MPPSSQPERNPGIFLCHHKCASAWLSGILGLYCAAFHKSQFATHLSESAPENAADFDVLLFANSDYHFCAQHLRSWLRPEAPPALHLIRNPLDVVISAYYSHLTTHPTEGWPELAQQREVLRNLDKMSGMLATWTFLERTDFFNGAVGPLFALRRWNFDDPLIKTLRMEDLTSDPELVRSELQLRLGSDPADIVSQFTFEKLSGGRSKGVVDDQHHFRSGLSHQWVQDMDVALAKAIYHSYQDLIDRFYPEVASLLKDKAS